MRKYKIVDYLEKEQEADFVDNSKSKTLREALSQFQIKDAENIIKKAKKYRRLTKDMFENSYIKVSEVLFHDFDAEMLKNAIRMACANEKIKCEI